MKSILISIKPKHCANILNEEKTIEYATQSWCYVETDEKGE